MNDEPLSGLLRQAIITTEKKLMVFSGSIWKYCPDTVRSTGLYVIFYQGDPIYHGTRVPV